MKMILAVIIAFIVLLVMDVPSSLARLPPEGKELTSSDRDLLNEFRGEGRLLSFSEKDVALRRKLDQFLARTPGTEAFRKRLAKQFEEGHEPVRIQLANADEAVIWTVWDRASGREIYSTNTTRGWANYFKEGLLSRPDACRFGCSITPGVK
jgi:hypothetical protein